MKKKRFLSVLIACMLIVSMLPLSAFAAMGDTTVMESEPNNTMVQADVIANGETAVGTLSGGKTTKDVADYWAITLETKSNLSVTFTGETSSMTAVVLDGEGEELAVTTAVESGITGKEDSVIGSLKTAEVELAAGTYYILVGDTKTSSLTEHSYMFYVTAEHVHTWKVTSSNLVNATSEFACTECDETKTDATTAITETEPNDSLKEAMRIAPGVVLAGTVARNEKAVDVDYYKLTLTEKSKISVTARSDSSILSVAVTKDGKKALAADNEGLLNKADRYYIYAAEAELEAGTYYIWVALSEEHTSKTPYFLTVTTEHVHTWEQTGKDMVRLEATYQCAECDEEKTEALSEVSETELNDGAEWAIEASFDAVYYGDVENSSANQDLEDWYKITVDERSKVIVNARSVSASLKLSIYDEAVNVLKEGADERFGITGRGYIYSMEEIVPAGTYYVVVSLTEEAEITEYHLGIAATPVEEEEPPVVEDNVYRIAGAGRYETGFAVADELKAALGVEKFEAAVIATGKNFADALAGSYLAVRKNAPILLTNGKDDNVAVLHDYIRANVAEGGSIYILGGTAAVPANVETIENDGYIVKRLAGASRYDTNLEILAEAGVEGDEIIVATGKTFADSLSASAAKLPILLVKPDANLNDAQKVVLAGMNNIYIVGGTGAVSANYADELEAFGTVTRVFGEGRYQTSVEVAKTFCGDVSIAVVASGKNFPDGLCGGPLAAALNAPLVLTKDGSGDIAAAYVTEEAITGGYVLGGSGAVADDTVVTVFGLENAAEIITK